MSNSQPDIIARHIQKTDHILDILEAIKQKHAQILISNTKPESLRWYISVLDLGAYFNDENTFAVDGHSKQPAKTKRDILQAFLKDKKFESIIIISDNIKDRAMSDIANSKFIQYRHTEMKTSESSQINDIREIMKYV
jgi:hypothetical protein